MGIMSRLSNSSSTTTTTNNNTSSIPAGPTNSTAASPLVNGNDKVYLWVLVVILPLIIVLVGLEILECLNCRKEKQESQLSPPPSPPPPPTTTTNSGPSTHRIISIGSNNSLGGDPVQSTHYMAQEVIPEQMHANASTQGQREGSAPAASGDVQGPTDEEIDITDVKRLD